jgi:hypothetical protein
VKIELETISSGTLTRDGEPVAIQANGKATVVYDLDPAILAAPITAALTDGAGVAPVTVKLALAKGSASPLEGAIELAVSGAVPDRARALLTEVAAGVALPADGTVAATKPTGASLIFLPVETYKKPTHFGRAGRLGELGFVAAARDLDSHEAGSCGPYATLAGSDSSAPSTVPRKTVDIEITIYDAATGEKVDQKAFTSDHEECPSIVMSSGGKFEPVESRPEDKVFARWLTDLAEKRKR